MYKKARGGVIVFAASPLIKTIVYHNVHSDL